MHLCESPFEEGGLAFSTGDDRLSEGYVEEALRALPSLTSTGVLLPNEAADRGRVGKAHRSSPFTCVLRGSSLKLERKGPSTYSRVSVLAGVSGAGWTLVETVARGVLSSPVGVCGLLHGPRASLSRKRENTEATLARRRKRLGPILTVINLGGDSDARLLS